MPLIGTADDKAAEAIDRLSKAAFDRFKTRLDWEWKARIALWTALGVATGFVLASDTWQPDKAAFWCVTIAMGLLILAYGVLFALPIHVLHGADIALWQACERVTAQIVGCDATVTNDVIAPPHRGKWAAALSIGQYLVTCIFAAALVFALYERSTAPASQQDVKSKVTVQQAVPSKVTVEPQP